MKKILCLMLALATVLAMLIVPVSADAVEAPTMLGASIRTDGTQGLRFVAKIKKNAALVYGQNANFGILIIPATATDTQNITAETAGVRIVKANEFMNEASCVAVGINDYDANYYYFNAVLTGIPNSFYTTKIYARAYAPGVNSGTMERSVLQVAEGVVAAGQATAAINTIVSEANAYGYDILVDAANYSVLESYPEYPASIDRDNLYTVSITNGQTTKNLKVYNECASYSQYDTSSTSRSLGVMDSNRRFCEFAFEWCTVTVNIKVNKKFTSYVVSPTSKGIASTFDASTGTISVTVTKHDQFVVILDDDYKTALAVFPDSPELSVPTKGAKNVVYVEGNNQITLPESQPTLVSYAGSSNEYMVVTNHNVKIYIAPGAVLKKRIAVIRAAADQQGYNTHIYGRGMILDPFSDYTASNPTEKLVLQDIYNFDSGAYNSVAVWDGSVVNCAYSFTMDDVKVVDSRNYNVWIRQESGTKLNNIKILSTEMSTDGLMITGNHEVKNSFVYCGDNALVMTGGTNAGTTYENLTIGTTCAVVYPQYSCHATLKDIYVFRADDNLINEHEDNGGTMVVNITGLDAIDCVKTPLIFGDNGGTGSDTKTFNIKNMALRFTTGSKMSFTAGTYSSQNNAMECSSSGYVFNFTNLYIGGHRIGPGNDGSTMKIGSYYIGGNSAGTGSAISGMTINFAYDSSDTPAHVSIPANKTANYTAGADYVAGPIRSWSRYTSYNCFGYISGGKYKVDFNTDKSTSHRWGYSIELTEQMKTNGPGTYSYSVTTSGKSTSGYLIKCANNSNSVTTTSGKSGSITVTASDLANYTYHFVVKASSNTTGTITLESWSFTKK